MSPKPETCPLCEASIYWAISDQKGTRFPVDAEPSPEGTILLHERAGVVRANVFSANLKLRQIEFDPSTAKRFRTNHLVTCPKNQGTEVP